MTMQLYKKRPVVIEAKRWDGSYESAMEILDWIELHDAVATESGPADNLRSLNIHTLEGTMRAIPGTYIIKGVKGEFYPCAADIFAETYAPLSEPLPDGPWAEGEIEAGRHLLWHSGHDHGYQPGSFAEKLIEALARADVINTEALLGAFPNYRRPLAILTAFGSQTLAEELELQDK